MMSVIEIGVALNSIVCAVTSAVVVAMLKDRSLSLQLKVLRFLVSYVMATLLANIYALAMGGDAISQYSLLLAAATVILLWMAIIKVWTKGE